MIARAARGRSGVSYKAVRVYRGAMEIDQPAYVNATMVTTVACATRAGDPLVASVSRHAREDGAL